MDLLDSFHLPAFVENADGSAGVRWKKWLKQFELHLQVKNIVKPEEKKTHLLYFGKDDVQKVIDQKEDTVDYVSDCYQRAIRTLNEYYLPKVSRIYERSVFRRLDRQENEKIEGFILRLRKQAEFCEFEDQLEYMIVDQIVEKMQENEIKKKILKGNFSLDEIQSMISAHELVQNQVKDFNVKEVTSFVNTVQDVKRVFETECFSCGKKGHRAKSSNCPALNKQCGICKRVGHFAAKCFKRGKGESYKNNYAKGGQNRYKPYSINQLSVESSPNVYQNTREIVCNLNAGSDIECIVGGVKLNLILDTGSSENIIGENDWQNYREKFIVQEQLVGSDKTFRAYGCKDSLKVMGRIKMKLAVKDNEIDVWFYIVSNGQRSLMSGETAEKLNLIKLNKETFFPKLRDVKAFIHIDASVNPVVQPYRRIPLSLEQKVVEKLKEMLKQDIVECVNEPARWISPMVLVPKKDDIRICIDMRQANKAVLREHYPLPTFEELSHRLVGCKIFSKVDIKQAYHQLELDEKCRHITTFITPLGLLRYKRLMFGLSSAPETFQKIMEFITRGLKGVLVYIDDIIVFAENCKDHEQRLRQLIIRLEYYNVILNRDKCQFGLNELDFLGFHISPNGVQVSLEKVDLIKNFAIPKSAEELSSFLGLISYVSKYIPHLATLSHPLNELTRKSNKFEWKEHHINAFNKLKEIIGARETLALFNYECPTYLFTDASPFGLGSVLVQNQNDTYRICAYASKTLSDTEKRYAQTEKEALAIVWGVERFHFFLFGIKFTIFTDHRPLTYIFNDKSKPCLRIERWVLRLQSYCYEIQYVCGKNNIADPFSRLLDRNQIAERNFDEHETLIHAVFSEINSISLSEIKAAMESDVELQEVANCLKTNKWSKELWRYKLLRAELSFDSGILLRNRRTVLPRKLQNRAIQLAHEGHQGIVKTKRQLREWVWFPFMDKLVEEFIGNCLGCTLMASTDKMEPIVCTELPSRPWKSLAVDFLGPLNSKEYILVVVDYYSRFIEVAIMTSITAENTFRKLREIFARHGYPDTLKSDYGPQFRDEFRKYCEQYDIKLIHSLPYAPHQNGEVERQNQGILKAIKISQALGRNWKSDLTDYLLMYRSTPQMTTNKSPAELLFGRKIKNRLPLFEKENGHDKDLKAVDAENKKKGKERSDKRAKKMNINVGDMVVVKKFIRKHKTDTNFDADPHEVIERSGTRVKVKSTTTGIMNDRYVGHVKTISSANPLLDTSSEQQAPEPSDENISEAAEVADTRPKRNIVKPKKMSDYHLFNIY